MSAAPLRTAATLLLTLGTLWSSAAGASDALVWDWDGEHRFQIRGDIQLNEWMSLNARHNRDVRISEIILGVNTTCSRTDTIGRRAVEISCSIDEMELLGTPVRADQGKLLPVLDELEEHYKQATIKLVMTRDGRVRSINMHGLDQRNRRINEIQEYMRVLINRLYAAFDLQLPRNGRLTDKAWKQPSNLPMQFPSLQGTMGSANIQNQIAKKEGSVVEITTQGRGTLGPGEMMTVATGAEQVKNLYAMTFDGLATFDTETGQLLERQYLIEGVPTASSLAAEAGAGVTYVQAVRLVRIEEGQSFPALGANEEIEARRSQTGTTLTQ